MRTTLSIFFILLSITAKSQSISIDSFITKASLEFTVSALAHDSMKGRHTATPETKNAADFIAGRFEKAGLQPISGYDKFFAYFPIKFRLNSQTVLADGINVIGALKGMESPDTSVVFCAHYDHIGVNRSAYIPGKDSIFNGANDNASGVALLIELAKYYAAIKSNRYTLVFIAFSGEEMGLLGSAYTAKDIDQSYIRAVFNFDMMGRPIDKWTKQCMVIAEEPKPIIKKLNAQIDPQKGFFISDKFPMADLFMRSDHYSFTGVKNRIFLTTSSPYDMYYHKMGDEYGTIDFDFLLLTTKNIAIACKIFLR